MDKSLKHHKILSVKVASTTHTEVLNVVKNSLKKRKHSAKPLFITTPNPEIVVKSQNDSELLVALNEADIALPDGVGIIYASKFLGLKLRERISGREMFEEMLELANKKRLKVFLLGGTSEVNKDALEKISKKYPKVKTKGSADIQINNKGYSVSERDRKRHIEILDTINVQKPDLLFVALGAPKQEKWALHNLDSLDVKVVMVVGGAFDYFAGKMSKPPALFARLGLEWLWRVLLEPTRIKRILNAVVVFPYLVLVDRFR
jgi:N-acetylglucosaminyldiphosphoundecaprenol N-acetyl-beta-D-mannosaminyltransferase